MESIEESSVEAIYSSPIQNLAFGLRVESKHQHKVFFPNGGIENNFDSPSTIQKECLHYDRRV